MKRNLLKQRLWYRSIFLSFPRSDRRYLLRQPEYCANYSPILRSFHSSKIINDSSGSAKNISMCMANSELAAACKKINEFDMDSVQSALDKMQKLSVQGKRRWVPKHEYSASATRSNGLQDQTKARLSPCLNAPAPLRMLAIPAETPRCTTARTFSRPSCAAPTSSAAQHRPPPSALSCTPPPSCAPTPAAPPSSGLPAPRWRRSPAHPPRTSPGWSGRSPGSGPSAPRRSGRPWRGAWRRLRTSSTPRCARARDSACARPPALHAVRARARERKCEGAKDRREKGSGGREGV